MKRPLKVTATAAAVALFAGCEPKVEGADLVLTGGTIYTVSAGSPTVEAVVVDDGRVLFTGAKSEALSFVSDDTKVIELGDDQIAIPGFNEGHGHIAGLGSALKTLDLTDAQSFEDLSQMVASASIELSDGEWIVGWGWHQSKWTDDESLYVSGFPVHDRLSELVPNHPVYLIHASGHASLVNARAMAMAGIDGDSEFGGDGQIIKDVDGNPTGILNENAVSLVAALAVPETVEEAKANISRAMAHALTQGVTSFHDAGITANELTAVKELGDSGELSVRLYAMLSSAQPELVAEWLAREPLVGAYDSFLTVRSIKVHADGALGSRGAWLHEEYTDLPGHYGMPTYSMDGVLELAHASLAKGYQLNVHAIGDRTNTEVLDRFAQAIAASEIKDHRFRIEHAQHLIPEDIERFAKLGVIPSMQAIHMSSDRPWAINRLGLERIESGAYMWSDLLDTGALIINGTDVPIEPINPIANFYASVTRRTLEGFPENGYEPTQKMTRQEALFSMTAAPAYGAFEEAYKGQLAPNYLADIVVLDRDILTIDEDEILDTQVVMTIVDGEVVYRAQ